jgi:U3 small nucleolar RNA-associated protein 11
MPSHDRKKQAAYMSLQQRVERHEKVSKSASRMAFEKEVMGKGRKRKLIIEDQEGGKQEVFKWKRERKK